MHKPVRLAAYAAALSSLALISGCGGGGSSSPPPAPAPSPPPPPVNTAPTFSTQSLTTDEEIDGTAQLTASDAQNNTLTFVIATQPQHGVATLSAAGALGYSPAANYFGSDSLTVTVTDSGGLSTTGTVNITVNNVHDAAVVTDDALRVPVSVGQPIVLDVLANDTSPDASTLTPSIVSQPPHGGTVVIDATTHVVTFQPTNGYVGPISFSYRVNDGTEDSEVANVRAVIGDFESVAFLSDYTTPGVPEVHAYDGLEIRRLSDALAAGSTITSFSFSNDVSTLAYTVSSADADRVYVKSLAGISPAVARYTSTKEAGATFGVSGALNADGAYMWVYDGYYAHANGNAKEYFVFDTATGTARQLAGDMPGVIDIRIVQWHTHEPSLLMVQGQTGGNIPADQTSAVSAFLGDATDVRTLDQIGLTYVPGEHGSGEGFYFGGETRYIYHSEYKRVGMDAPITLLRYDRLLETTTPVVRTPVPPDRGLNGTVSTSTDRSRMCFGYYESSTTTNTGPSKFYAMNQSAPGSEMAVTPVISDISTCQFGSDNRTMIYRAWTANHLNQQAFVIDSVTPGLAVALAPVAETGNEQHHWQAAPEAMRIAIWYHDYDGNPGYSGNGRYYSMPVDGSGNGFLFSDTFQPSFVVPFATSSADGSFIVHTRLQGGVEKLELMSTHALNLSIPLSAAGETIGARNIRWMRRY